MDESLSAMQISLRVLTAINHRQDPAPEDIRFLRTLAGADSERIDADELACVVIQTALARRAAARASGLSKDGKRRGTARK
jgi:hypothetical protein